MVRLIRFLAILAVLALTPSCALFKKAGSIITPQGTVIGVKDAGKPATLASEGSVATLTLPAGTNVTTVKESALAGILASDSSPAIPPKPEREVTTFVLPSEAKWVKTETKLSANTGTVDTSIAEHKIDVQAAQPLLYAALLSLVAAGFFVYRAYPTPALICGGASAVFLLAWKAAGAPSWLWAVGAVALAGAAFLFIGHERGEKSKLP
jgi:hypothetical protein